MSQHDEINIFMLRKSVARIAQSLEVETEHLDLLQADDARLDDLCKQPYGWNALCGKIVGEVQELKQSEVELSELRARFL